MLDDGRVRNQQRQPTGPLVATEVAEAALLADVGLVLCLVSWMVPLGPLAPAALALAVVPFTVLVARRRLRAIVAGTVSAGVLSVLVGGPLLAVNVGGCALLGACLGRELRRGRRYLPALVRSVVMTSAAGTAFSLPVLALFRDFRQLSLEQVALVGEALSNGVRAAGLSGAADDGAEVVAWAVTHWWLTIPALQVVFVTGLAAVALALARPVLPRLPQAVTGPPVPAEEFLDGRGPAPVPVTLFGAGHTYPGATSPALVDVSITIPPGVLVAVVGRNGAGKSTLARVVAGLEPSSGRVRRPGPVGLGRPGGTAMIFQRPESQVLGARVDDDLRWGLPVHAAVDVEDLLRQVGLAGFAERETATLSGGELQRLALAAALARRPQLLVSDESTAMLDATGRAQLLSLLRAIVDRHGTTVVHVTHDPEEAAVADVVLTLEGGRLVSPGSLRTPVKAVPMVRPASRSGGPLLRLHGVGHTFAAGTPWTRPALHGIDLSVAEGEGVLVVGDNGSGKSTLAWVLAGLIAPTEGTATLAGRALSDCVGQVGLSFQHARLQLLRATVAGDVGAAAGGDDTEVQQALRLVGLDPKEFGLRRIDELSGGEQRRVVLAGLLARRPRVLVLDEPFAGLDVDARELLATALGDAQRRHGLTLVMVSHDLAAVDGLVDRVIRIDQGRIQEDHPVTASVVTTPVSAGVSP